MLVFFFYNQKDLFVIINMILHQRKWPSELLLILLTTWKPCSTLELGQCKAPLGMESKEIKDEDISASSAFDQSSVGPHNARIRHDINGGAWCPKPPIKEDVTEFLEINLNEMRVITAIETQGRFGNGEGKEYAENFLLEYWRPGMSDWVRFKDRKGEELFAGNINTYTELKQEVNPPIIASNIRFLPYSVHPRTVCMRVELYGCTWRDSLISYSMPQGERRGSEIDLFDMVYDGVEEGGFLNGGLGQLTDGQKGHDNFRLDSNGFGKGYEWVGWKNDTGHMRPVEMTFEFDEVRNFSAAYFYANNLFTKDVQVFAGAFVSFSIGGHSYVGEPLHFSYMPDTVVENARNITIHLHGRAGRFVKFQLHFASKWMLISEVSFDSVVAVGNFSEEVDAPALPDGRAVPAGNKEDQGVSTAVNSTNQYIGLVIGVLAAVIMLLMLIIFVIIVRNRRRKQNNNHTVLKPVEKRVTINMKVALEEPDKSYFHKPYKPYQEPYNAGVVGYTKRKLPDVPLSPDYTASSTSREYAVPDITSTLIASPMVFPRTASLASNNTTAERHYAATEICTVPSVHGGSSTMTYAAPGVDLLSQDDFLGTSTGSAGGTVCEFPRHRLRFLEKLGEGQFGEVNLCEAEGIPELVDVPTFGTSRLVAVKVLRLNASEAARCDFHKEVRILATLRDPNIVHVLGVCTRDDPLCMIVEYMENGDLNQFLQDHVAELTCVTSGGNSSPPPPPPSPLPNNAQVLSYGSLIYMATQIASGMKYLESLNFVHRDLATRNCLVGQAYSIKIADFGMSRNLYAADYYKIEGRAMLPIRWMAWESILLGKFTTKSDVWSFAVTLWEVLTLAREQPYEDMNDEKVIENVGHFYHNNGLYVYLPQPINCPKEIYDLMRECWQRNEVERPNFREIHLFLQRKNLGYQPEVL